MDTVTSQAVNSYPEDLPLADDGFSYVDYPDEWFPVSLPCGACGQTYWYTAGHVQSETAREPHHPADWKPFLGEPPMKP